MKTNFNNFIKELSMVWEFSKNDLKKRYAGSVGGILWAYIQPLVAILVFWFVFQLGFKNPPVDNFPFILWLVPSYIVWTYINDSILQSTNTLYDYSFLVKKVKFKTYLLPLIKVLSSFIIHTFFIFFVFVIYMLYGYKPNIMWFQVLYYTFAASFLLTGLSWWVSSLSVFLKDFSQIVNVFLQIGFWMVPVFWNPDTMSNKILTILKLNPFYYIVNGYRDCFVNNSGFWNYQIQSIYFWVVSLLIFFGGMLVFKKLSKHYSDLL